jgi:hypothetical protein
MSLLTGYFVSEGITQDAQIPPSWWIYGLVRGTMVRSFGGVFGGLQTSPFWKHATEEMWRNSNQKTSGVAKGGGNECAEVSVKEIICTKSSRTLVPHRPAAMSDNDLAA